MVTFGAILFVAMLAAIYFLPTIVAVARVHRYMPVILFINIFFGWTAVGWIIVLIWAIIGEKRAIVQAPLPVAQTPQAPKYVLDQLELDLAGC
jgi:hypothetical protein